MSMNESIKTMLLTAVKEASNGQERSQQVDVGPSEIGGCRRRVWHRLNGTAATNSDTKVLASFMGTAIHDWIEHALVSIDPFEMGLHRELEVAADGLRGHVDLFDESRKLVVDWKTTTKKNLSYFPSKQQRTQVQVYGWLLKENGYDVDHVSLVAIPRDGNEDDVVVHVEEYDEAMALEALAWLEEVKALTEVPAPEKADTFCRSYCQFFGACPGLPAKAAADAPLLDEDTSVLVREYVAARNAKDEASGRMDALKDALSDVVGRTEDGLAVSWSERQSRSVDRDAIAAALGEVPMKAGAVAQVLSVKVVKA